MKHITTRDSDSAMAIGNYGNATATGDYGSATAIGDYSRATAIDDYGSAMVAGEYGHASAAGCFGHASATCKFGVAIAGYGGAAKADKNGCIAIIYWDVEAKRPRIAVGYVGENGIKAGTWYCVKDGILKEDVE